MTSGTGNYGNFLLFHPKLIHCTSIPRCYRSFAVTTIVVFWALVSGALSQVRYPCSDFARDEVVLLNHATSCSKYVMCFGGDTVIRTCAPGLTFDVEDGHCKENAICDVENRPCPQYDDPTNLIFHPHPDFCDQFSLCLNGEPLNRTCAEGLHWDRENSWCNFPDEVNCPVSVVSDYMRI